MPQPPAPSLAILPLGKRLMDRRFGSIRHSNCSMELPWEDPSVPSDPSGLHHARKVTASQLHV